MSERDLKLIGERLERFREIRGLSRTVVAQRLGIPSEELADLEGGRKPPRKEWIETLRDAFALDPAWLLGGKTLEDL
jgi:transcriptional regulator with XRE-family HTH domain